MSGGPERLRLGTHSGVRTKSNVLYTCTMIASVIAINSTKKSGSNKSKTSSHPTLFAMCCANALAMLIVVMMAVYRTRSRIQRAPSLFEGFVNTPVSHAKQSVTPEYAMKSKSVFCTVSAAQSTVFASGASKPM